MSREKSKILFYSPRRHEEREDFSEGNVTLYLRSRRRVRLGADEKEAKEAKKKQTKKGADHRSAETDRADGIEIFDLPENRHAQGAQATAKNSDQQRPQQTTGFLAGKETAHDQTDHGREPDPKQDRIHPKLREVAQIVIGHGTPNEDGERLQGSVKE